MIRVVPWGGTFHPIPNYESFVVSTTPASAGFSSPLLFAGRYIQSVIRLRARCDTVANQITDMSKRASVKVACLGIDSRRISDNGSFRHAMF